jgi:hypothetical protein
MITIQNLKILEILMKQFDNYELTTLDYALKYYLEENPNLDEDDIEWCNLVRKKIDQNVAINVLSQPSL